VVLYSEAISNRLTGRHRSSLRLCGDLAGKRILNIGCYNGWFEKAAVAAGATKVVGIDTDPKFIAEAQRNVSDAEFLKMSVLDLSCPSNHFDLVTMFDVLEHLPRDSEERCLSEVRGVLKVGGQFILSTPNDNWWAKVLDPAWYFGHRHYGRKRLLRFLEEAGFRVEGVSYGGGFAELFSMILLYFCKHFLRCEVPFRGFWERLRDREYRSDAPHAFATIFVEARG